jgi:hypothetical protein
MAIHLKWSQETDTNSANNVEALVIGGIIGSLVSVQYTVQSNSVAQVPNGAQFVARYLFDIRRGSVASSVDAGGSGFLLQAASGGLTSTGTSGLLKNGIAATSLDFFNNYSAGDILKFNVGSIPSNGFIAFGARYNAVESMYGLAISEIQIVDGNGLHIIDMNSSGGTGSSVSSTDAALTATLVNFPTNGTQWVSSGPDYTQRKGSTFTATHTLGTITTATLNTAAITINTTGAGTVNLTDTSGVTTSGVYNLVLGDGAATQTQTVQVNVFGVVPSNNPAQKDGSALASLTGIQIRITAGANLNGTQVYYSGTQTTDASGNFFALDVSSSAAVAAAPVLMQVLTAAGDSITSAETVGLI